MKQYVGGWQPSIPANSGYFAVYDDAIYHYVIYYPNALIPLSAQLRLIAIEPR